MKLVPVLNPLDTANPIKKLVKQTKEDIAELNAFLFPNTGGSLDHVNGWKSYQAVTKIMGPKLQKPNLSIAEKFCHRLSTLFAVLELPQSERDTFYDKSGYLS